MFFKAARVVGGHGSWNLSQIWHICLRAMASLHGINQSQSCWSPRLLYCALGRTEMQLGSSYGPHKWESLLMTHAIGVIAVCLWRGSEISLSPGHDQYSAGLIKRGEVPLQCPAGRWNPAHFGLSNRKLMERQEACQYQMCLQSAVYIICPWGLQRRRHFWSIVWVRVFRVYGCITWQNMSQFGLKIDAVRVGSTNQNHWISGAVRSCHTLCVFHQTFYSINNPPSWKSICRQSLWEIATVRE